jgi:hypothetical protein
VVSCAIAMLLVIGLFPRTLRAGGRGNSTYDGTIDFGAQVIEGTAPCLAVDGKIASGAFFDDLKRVKVGGRFEFTKHGRAVTEYPGSLTTSILIVDQPCESELPDLDFSIFHGNTYGLRFEVHWKDGMQLRSAALSPVVARCTSYSGIHAASLELKASSILCQLTVDSQGVSLDNHLIVSIFSTDGKRLTRLSARP